jgi:hypothetical protein
MGWSLLGGDKRPWPCAGALGILAPFTDVDDPRLLGPETMQDTIRNKHHGTTIQKLKTYVLT